MDDVVREHWLSSICAALEHEDAVGGPADTGEVNTTHTQGVRSVLPDRLECPLGWLPAGFGCNIGVRAEVFSAVGGWDETVRAA